MDNLTTIQSVKQETRKFMAVATDKMALASASVSRGETHVSRDCLGVCGLRTSLGLEGEQLLALRCLWCHVACLIHIAVVR